MKEYGEVIENVDLKPYTTFGIGGKCKYLIRPNDINSLSQLIKYLNKYHYKYYILGNGSNVILDDSYFDGVIIKLDKFNNINYNDNLVTVGSGMNLPLFVLDTLDKGFVSLSFAATIPGAVGGSVVGNAGCYGHELMEYVENVELVDYEGNIKVLNKDDFSYSYRDTSLKGKGIITNVTFKIEKGDTKEARNIMNENRKKRFETQPLDKKSVGSIFRNPAPYASGKLIEDAGLKNYKINDARISEKHANFIVNDNNASFNDVINLIKYIQQKIKEKNNIDLVVEPIIVKWNKI